MSSLRNIKKYVQAVRQNKGILLTDQVQLPTESLPVDGNLVVGRMYCDGSTIYGYNGSSWVDMMTTSTINIAAWETLYAADTQLNMAGSTLTFAGTHASNDTLAITADGTGDCLILTQGSTGYDISANTDSWTIKTSSGVAVVELGSTATINASGGALTIGKTGTATTLSGTLTVDEASTLTGAVTATASVTITGSADTECLIVTAGDVTITAGLLSLDDDDTTTGNLVIPSSTATTGNPISVTADDLTDGAALYVDSAGEANFTNDGGYLNLTLSGTSVFKVQRYGATTITGHDGTAILVIDAGDITVTQGSINITADDDNEATLSLVNDTATTADVVSFTGSGAFTGDSWMLVSPSGLTTGRAVEITCAALTQGEALYVTTSAITSGNAVYITNAGEAMTSGELVTVLNDQLGTNATASGNVVSFTSSIEETGASRTVAYDNVLVSRTDIANTAAATHTCTGSALRVLHTSTQTQATMADTVIGLEVELSGATALGHAAQITNVGATGSALNIVSANTGAADVLVTSSGIHTNGYGAVNITTSGDLATGGANLILTVSGSSCDAAARAFEISAAKDVHAMYVDTAAATNDAIYISHTGNLAAGKAVLHVTDAGIPAADNVYVGHFAFAGTATAESVVLFADGGGKDVTGLYVDCDCVDTAANVSAQATLFSDAAGNLPVLMQFYHSDAGAADGEIQARINFYGSNSTPAKNLYAKIEVASDDVTAATEDGSVTIFADLNSVITASAVFTGNQVALGAAAATLTTNGAWDLTLSTNKGTDSGTIVITDAANENITITPNGTGAIDLAGKVLHSETTTSTGAGAVAVTGTVHEITTTGTGDAMTLVNGTEGQILHIVYVAEGAGADTAILQPTSFNDTSITFTDLGEGVTLLYTAAKWYVIGNGGTTIA